MKIKQILTGEWGLYEKHFQSLINKGKINKIFLQISNDFDMKLLILRGSGDLMKTLIKKETGEIMKTTLLFSNIIGDVTAKENGNIRFNQYMEDFLSENIKKEFKLVFINAPGLGGEENYLNNIIKCFEKIGIEFSEIFDLEYNSDSNKLESFIKDKKEVIYFLMGGNPLTQMEIIKKFNLENRIKEHNGLVIGFCAGAINLSKYSIITTDEDFDKCQSYKGIERISIIIEPHYNVINDPNRNEELSDFAKQYNQTIYAVPDESIIVVENDNITEYGKIYHIKEQ